MATATKKRTKPLTATEQRALEAARSEWLAVGLSTEPADRPEAEAAVKDLYAVMGWKEPMTIWMESPLGGCYAAAWFEEFTKAASKKGQLGQLDGQLDGQLVDQLHGQLHGQLDGQLDGQLVDQLHDQLRGQLRGQLGQLRGQLGDQLHDQLRGQLVDQLHDQLHGQLHGQLVDQLRGQLGQLGQLVDQLHDQLRGQLGQLRDQLGDQLHDQLHGQLHGQLHDQLHGQLHGQLVDQLRGQLGQLDGQLDGQLHGAWWGQHEAWWVAWLSFAREVGVTYDKRLDQGLVAWSRISRSSGWWWPREGVVILTERPTVLHRDPAPANRPHCEDGPAILYPDGWGVWAWHGIRVEQEIIEDPKALNAKRITEEGNAELRRAYMEIYGTAKYMAEAGGEMLDKVHEPAFPGLIDAELWQMPNPDGGEPFVCVKCRNSTPEPDGTYKHYHLWVHPECRPLLPENEFGEPQFGDPQELTAHNALASTYGERGETYSPALET